MRKKINALVLLIVILFITSIRDSIADTQEVITGTLSADNLIGSYKIKKENKGLKIGNFFIKDYIAYIACMDRGLLMLDISDNVNPKLLNSYQFAKNTNTVDVFVENGIAYVVNHQQGLKILDVSNPKKPTLLGSYGMEAASSIYVANNIAYVSGTPMDIIDVSDPSSPTLLGSIDVGIRPSPICGSGNYVYVGDADGAGSGAQIIDVSNPSAPVLVGQAQASSTRLLYANGYLYGTAGGTPYKVDINDPTSPYVESYLPGADVDAIYAVDNKLYEHGAINDSGPKFILVIDLISDELVERYSYHSKYSYISSYISDMKIIDGVIYISKDYNLEIYDLEGPAVISSLNKKKSVPGGALTIAGEKFGTAQGKVTAKQGDKTYNCSIVSWSDTEISITLPKKLKPGTATIRLTKSTDLKSKNYKTIQIKKSN